jgi:hypothetical protein
METAFLTHHNGKTEYPHLEDWNWTPISQPAEKLSLKGSKS